VYTFLQNLTPPLLKLQQAILEQEQQTKQAVAGSSEGAKDAPRRPYAELMKAALDAKARNDFTAARQILAGVRAAQGDRPDEFVVQQLALATYKSKDLDAHQRLLDARKLMAVLKPESSGDPETLGLWGAIHKRILEAQGSPEDERREALDQAIWAHEKGFYLKNDHYNGINYAFLLDRRAAEGSGEDRIADRVLARRVRQRVLKLCDEALARGFSHLEEEQRAEAEYWVRATRAEALFGLGLPEVDALNVAEGMNPKPQGWMIDSTKEQLGKLGQLLRAA
jgi:hypothetical protein